MGRKIGIFCLIMLLLSCTATAFAQDLDLDRTGSISVTLKEQETKQPIADAELALYYVATVRLNDRGNLSYTYTKDFEACGTALDDPALAARLDPFVQTHAISSRKAVTDVQGRAVWSDLPLGLYFVKQTNAVDGFATCTSFLVTVPGKDGQGYLYHMEATPKTEVHKSTTIVIKKLWNTDASTKIADSVTVQLLRDDVVVETATLNEQNNWTATYTDMPLSDSYRIEEIMIPEGFTATYTHQGAVYTVINSAELPQTGQLLWPIPVLAAVGMLLLAAGVAALRKSGKKNAE